MEEAKERNDEIASLRAELKHETNATQAALRDQEGQHKSRMDEHFSGFEQLKVKHGALQAKHEEFQGEFSQRMAALAAEKDRAIEAALERGERQAM